MEWLCIGMFASGLLIFTFCFFHITTRIADLERMMHEMYRYYLVVKYTDPKMFPEAHHRTFDEEVQA